MELKLTQTSQNRIEDYAPVKMDDGTELTFALRKTETGTIIRCSAVKDGKEIGYGSWNTTADRFAVRVEPMSQSGDAKALAKAVMDGIVQILDTL